MNIALETMAGKGTECGRSFEEIAKIIDGVKYNENYPYALIRAIRTMQDMTL